MSEKRDDDLLGPLMPGDRAEVFSGLEALMSKMIDTGPILGTALESAVPGSVLKTLLAGMPAYAPKVVYGAPSLTEKEMIAALAVKVGDLARLLVLLGERVLWIGDTGRQIRGYAHITETAKAIMETLPYTEHSQRKAKSATVKAEPQAPFLAGLDAIDLSSRPRRKPLRLPRTPRARR